jgi:hypothetical protein
MDNVPERFTTIRDTAKNIIRISMINVPVIDLYKRSLYGSGLRPAFIILEVADTQRYIFRQKYGYHQGWLAHNTYCYDGSFPLNYSASEIKKKISSDLDFYLQLHGRIERRNIDCWVITKDSYEPKLIKSSSANPSVSKAVTLSDIVFYLNAHFGDTPAIIETGSPELKIEGLSKDEYTDIPFLSKKLKENGLKISKSNRLIEVLVITENQSK